MTIITKATTGYPEECRDALFGSDFDLRVTTTRDRDTYTTQMQGGMTQTDCAFAIAVILENAMLDDALDTLEQARNMVLGRQWMIQEACNG